MFPCGEFLTRAHKKEQCGKNQVDDNDQENGHHHGARRGAANLLGASSGGEALQTADSCDSDAKHDAFNESSDDITEEERVKGGPNVARERKVGFRDAEKRPAKNAHGVGPNGETRQHHGHGDELGGDQKMHGADGHGFESVDFFGDFHGADFRREGGAGTANHDDSGDERAKFARHGDGHGGGDVAHGAETAELVGG